MSITPLERPLDNDNPPSPSCIWQRFPNTTTTYQLISEEGNKSVFLIKVNEAEKFVLLSRSLPSSISINEVYSAFLEEIEMLKVFHKKKFNVPRLIDAETSEEQSFWNGSTFFVDLLFQLEGVEFELTLMKHQIYKMSSLASVESSDFQKLADLAQIHQQFLNLQFPPGYLTEGTCLSKSTMTADTPEEGGKLDNSMAPVSHYGEWELVLLSAGILDRQLERRGISDEEIVRENQKFIMQHFCQMASGDMIAKKLEDYSNSTSALAGKYKPENEEGYKAELGQMLSEMIYEKPTGSSYTKLEEFMRKYTKTEDKSFSLTQDEIKSNLFAKPNEGSRVVKTNLGSHSCFFANRFILIGIVILAVIACSVVYPFIDFGDGKVNLSVESTTLLSNIQKSKQLLAQYTANGTTSSGNELQDLTNQINLLIEKYDTVQKKISDNRAAISEKQAELEDAANQIAIKETEYLQAKMVWDSQFKIQESAIESLIAENLTLTGKITSQIALNGNTAAQNEAIKAEIVKKQKIIQQTGTEFFQSMLDVADMDKLSQTIYRIFQLESITDVCLTQDGGYVISGTNFEATSTPSLEAVLVKMNSLGQEQWRRIINYEGSDRAYSVTEAPNGDLVTAGSILPNYYAFNDDLWVNRMNSTGADVWKYTYPYSEDGAHGVLYTSDDCILVVGSISDYDADATRPWIVKMDKDKNIIWDLNLNWVQNDDIGWNALVNDARHSIETSDGHYLIVGFLDSYIWALKVTPFGMLSFNIQTDIVGLAQEVREAPDGNYVIVSSNTCGMLSGSDSIILKISKTDGSKIWVKRFHDDNYYFSYNLQCMEKLSDGFIFGGEKNYYDQYGAKQGMNWIVRTDFSAEVKWQRTFGGGRITRIKVATDGAIVLTQTEDGGVSSFLKFYEKAGCT